jgi:hypothetical protein
MLVEEECFFLFFSASEGKTVLLFRFSSFQRKAKRMKAKRASQNI